MDSSTPALSAGQLSTPTLGALLLLALLAHLVLFDQGQVGLLLTDAMADSGGLLHELFHDGRHLFGVPCH